MFNYSKDLFGFKEVNIKKVINENSVKHVYVETTIEAQECPTCGKLAHKIKGYGRERQIQAMEILGYDSVIHYTPKRLRCECGKTFSVNSPDIPGRTKLTNDRKAKIYQDLKLKISMREVARLNNVSVSYVEYLLDKLSYPLDEIGEIVCIDEFKGNMDDEKYQAIMVNPITKKVTNIYSSRKKKLLYRELSKIPKYKRDRVKFFICDMWDTYIELAQIFFRNATIVIDRFHYTRVVTNAFNKIRIQTQNERSDEMRISFKHSRGLLMKRTNMLIQNEKVDQYLKVDMLLGCSYKLEKAYGLLQRFYEFNDSVTLDEARHKFINFIYACYDSKLPEFEEAAKTLQNYSEYILNSFKTKYTNSYAEGKNTLMKTLKRIGFGYKKKDRFLKRVMHIENY